MNEERRIILEMLKEGAISVEEAERLMEAVPAAESAERAEQSLTCRAGETLTPGFAPKRIKIQVMEGGKNKVNVKIPFSLVRVGLKLGQSFGALGAKYVDEDSAQALELLKNIDIDELLGSISDGDITLPYVMVDVDEAEGERVLVVLE